MNGKNEKIILLEKEIKKLLKDGPVDPMALKNGCKVKVHYCYEGDRIEIVQNFISKDQIFNIYPNNLNWRVNDIDIKDILGVEIGLPEVMQALSDKIMCLTCDGTFIEGSKWYQSWDFSKLMKDQSEVIIDFLYENLCHG